MNGNDLIYDETNVLLQKENSILIEQNIKMYQALEKIYNETNDMGISSIAADAIRDYNQS